MMRLILDGNILKYRSRVHSKLARSLHFPGWYGRNLDALYDCLTDLHEETELILVNWTVPSLLPMRQVMEDAAAENPHLTVTVKDALDA